MWAKTGILAAFALVLTYVETFLPLPIPVPGAKLGLANIPVLMALKILNTKSALVIALIKVLVTGLLFGSPIMIPYSLAGTLFALLVMRLLSFIPGLHVIIISIAGSVFHIVGQLAVASLMLGTLLVWYTLPLLLVVACATGVLTGNITIYLLSHLDTKGQPDATALISPKTKSSKASRDFSRDLLGSTEKKPLYPLLEKADTRILIIALALYIIVVFCVQSDIVLYICVIVAVVMAVIAKIRVRDALKALVPLASILIVTAVAQILYVQEGQVVAALGPFVVTQEALVVVGRMLLRLICVMIASIAFMNITTTDKLIVALDSMLRPLKKLGVKTEVFILTLNLTLQFLPILLAEFKQLKAEAEAEDPHFGKGGLLTKARSYQKLLPPLATNSFRYAEEVADSYTNGSYRLKVS